MTENLQTSVLAAECCQFANACLAQAQREHFADKQRLHVAAEYFATALGLDVLCLDAYLGLAYLLTLTNQFSKALDVLLQATDFAPEEPRVGALKAEVLNLMHRSPELLLNKVSGKSKGSVQAVTSIGTVKRVKSTESVPFDPTSQLVQFCFPSSEES